jgi:translation initiation factor IF-2
MGSAFTMGIDSLQVERQPVRQAGAGQQAGIFIPGKRQVNIGDEVACLEAADVRKHSPWQPTCGIFEKD